MSVCKCATWAIIGIGNINHALQTGHHPDCDGTGQVKHTLTPDTPEYERRQKEAKSDER